RTSWAAAGSAPAPRWQLSPVSSMRHRPQAPRRSHGPGDWYAGAGVALLIDGSLADRTSSDEWSSRHFSMPGCSRQAPASMAPLLISQKADPVRATWRAPDPRRQLDIDTEIEPEPRTHDGPDVGRWHLAA